MSGKCRVFLGITSVRKGMMNSMYNNMETKDLLELLETEHKTLQFSEFTNETALKIGLSIIERAKKENKAIAIDITRNGHQIFHYAFEGASPDNDQWIIGKSRVVNRFFKSSLYVTTFLESIGKTMEDRYFISSMDYRPRGGSFPIIIKNVGVVGTITVSGLFHMDDHEVVVTAIKEYLK